VVRRATHFASSLKPGVFTNREAQPRSPHYGAQPDAAQVNDGQPNLNGLALLLAMPDQPSSETPSGPQPVSVVDDTATADTSNTSRLVLLIDDDEVVVRLLERALSSENYRSLAISPGRGLDLSGLKERPLAIVVDITVPEVDGFEIIPRLNQHPLAQGVPIVMMSTRSGLKDRRTGRSLQNFLTKPFRPSQLLQMLRKFAKGDSKQ
jgi:CheY-like chemotaxis protein